MKKIISLIAVVAMLVTFCVTASAATATMVVAPIELDVAEGTQETVMNVVFNMDEAAYLYGVQLEFVLPEGVTLKAVDWTALSSICPTTSNDDVKDLAAGKASFFEGGAEGTTEAVSELVIPCTLVVDTTVAKEYVISFTDSTGILDVDTFDYINAGCPDATITVAAAAPSTKADVVTEAIDADVDTIEGYTNYAIYDYTFAAPANAISVESYGITVNDAETDFAFDGVISGDTHVVLAIVGIAAEDVANAVVEAYYNVTVSAQ